MKINIFNPENCDNFHPITCTRQLSDCPIAGITIEKLLEKKVKDIIEKHPDWDSSEQINIRSDFYPSNSLLSEIIKNKLAVKAEDNTLYCYITNFENNTAVSDQDSICLKYSWDVLKINEKVIEGFNENNIQGTIKEHVVIDGIIKLGKGSVLLPGVYIEGNVTIGENCKIGPNCYIRGNTHIGNSCHIGQSVEIKNSILMDKVSVGHLSYVGDAIIGEKTNFGAGTVMANLRHDGKNHKSEIKRTTNRYRKKKIRSNNRR